MNINLLNTKAYMQGKYACILHNSYKPNKTLNPYKKHTIKWYSWNRGWNYDI